ncbi:hypothetical protein MKJ04_06480 [Pontibacter sp. E15-1]|uniref:hypothetical protein n=1 Tax=Pontibacter sp. E15-1 TaxID=2919918 RepID=UPI001F4F5AE9|nr:hypothetical protein [Pontibacter sp. E15-1]MCJ8164486.1 hypothetical protein [Pontibacter sp. E15-1]
MTLEELAQTENNLYSIVMDLYYQEMTIDSDKKLIEVFASYKQVHLQYSLLAKENSEALKRGLFIQWYALTEPNYLTGVNEVDEQAELRIISLIDAKIGNSNLDSEFHWMLNYYAAWDYVFQRFPKFMNLNEFVEGAKPDAFPEKIDRKVMNKRGQMGMYWNSLSVFKE